MSLEESNYGPEVSQRYVKIPTERIGVLIGKKGTVVDKIKRECGVSISVESDSGTVTIVYDGRSLSKGDPFKAIEIISAIARGFSPDKAFRLLREDMVYQLLDIRDYTGNSNRAVGRLKGRIIGERGKARRTIEELSGSYISVYGHTVGFIGNFDAIKIALEAVGLLSEGSSHRNVYVMLQNYRRKQKMEKMLLWQENLAEEKTSEVKT